MRTYAAPAGTPTALTFEDAQTGPDFPNWRGSSQQTELRLVITGDFGCKSQPTGVVRQTGWVVTIHDTAPVRGGPPAAPPPDPAVRCDSVVIVDARTGALLLNMPTCGDPADPG